MNFKPSLTVLRQLVLAAVALPPGLACSADLVVITHSGTTLSADDIKDVYSGQTQMSGATRLVPVDNGAAQEAFLAQVVKSDLSRYNSAWVKKSFRDGISAPAVKTGDADVLDFVRRTPGAVGYVRVVPAGVNVVQLK